MEPNKSLVVFESREIRKIWHNEEWWFSVQDVVIAFTNSKDPKWYIGDLRRRNEELSKGWGQIATLLQ